MKFTTLARVCADQHQATCADLARRIEDFTPVETHAAYLARLKHYLARLKQDHGRKSGFWSQVVDDVLLPEHQVAPRWKHCGSTRAETAAQ